MLCCFRHGGIEHSHLHFTSNGFDDLLIQNIKLISSNQKTRQLLESSSGEETGQAVIRSYESLAKLLRSLDLPLSFHTIQSLSPVLRGTEVSNIVMNVAARSVVTRMTLRNSYYLNCLLIQGVSSATYECRYKDDINGEKNREVSKMVSCK